MSQTTLEQVGGEAVPEGVTRRRIRHPGRLHRVLHTALHGLRVHVVAAPGARPIEQRLRSLFTSIGRFSEEAVLNSGDTAEVPVGEAEPNACILFSAFEGPTPFRIGPRTHGLLLVTEVFPEEMALAREQGSAELIARLSRAGFFPRSDLDRESVAGA